MRNLINKKLVQLEMERASALIIDEKILKEEKQQLVAERALLIMQKAAKLSQDHLAAHLSTIVTPAIQAVIEKPYEFVCEFVERRGSTEADLYLTKEGEKFDILEGSGGGLADVCSLTLKVAYLLLSNSSKFLVIDEVSRHINGHKQRSNFAAVLARLSEDFGIQMILNTTIPELIAVSDKVFTLSQEGGETIVTAV